MPFRITRTLIRPNNQVRFHNQAIMSKDDEFVKIVDNAFNRGIEYGLQDRQELVPVDELTVKVTITWDSKEQRDEFQNHPAMMEYYALINKYNSEHGIISNIIEEEI